MPIDAWRQLARPEQLPPDGDWLTWLILAGRGFGKTRAGAEWVREIALSDARARIALVGASLIEARQVMVEGESGLLAISGDGSDRPRWMPSLRRLAWPNGASASLFSAAEPESLRGPQHSHGWCDEIAKWDNAGQRAMRAWDNLLMGLRVGERPRLVATTTPRAVPLVQRLVGERQTTITRGRTTDNRVNLPAPFLRAMEELYAGSELGRQELDGELLVDREGALWSRALIARCRCPLPGDLDRIVVGVDPPATDRGDACGIIVVGRTAAGQACVLADCSVERPSPARWAEATATAFTAWQADRVVAEANQGGDMVRDVLSARLAGLPLRLVHASRGKVARAEPVAALYEAGRAWHCGAFPALEDQLCGLMPGGGYEGPGRSPDRADALVWAMTELMIGGSGPPRIRTTF